MKTRNFSLVILSFLILPFFVGCSKSSSEPVPFIDEIPGTYIGDLLIVYGNEEDYEWVNEAVFIVTKEGNNRIKVKPITGESYSNQPECIFPVFYSEEGNAIITVLGDMTGAFSYNIDSKLLGFNPFPKNGEKNYYVFEGIKK